MTKLAIDLKNLSKSFGDRKVLENFNIQVPEAQIYGFLGPNGSGKTTTIRLICGLLTADSGEGTCLGYDIIKQAALIKRNVGYMPQKFSLYEDLTVQENLDLVSQLFEIDNSKKAVADTISWLGLEHRANQLAGTLSGGWKQRLSLAAAIIHQPKLLLLDEPTAGVDPKARREFWNYIHSLVDQGITILVSTHYMDEAERCNQIAYLFYGTILLRGETHKVIEDSGLFTFKISGDLNDSLIRALEAEPGVEQVAFFGNTLHITGLDPTLLAKSIKTQQKKFKFEFEQISPSLEDVFVHITKEQERLDG